MGTDARRTSSCAASPVSRPDGQGPRDGETSFRSSGGFSPPPARGKVEVTPGSNGSRRRARGVDRRGPRSRALPVCRRVREVPDRGAPEARDPLAILRSSRSRDWADGFTSRKSPPWRARRGSGGGGRRNAGGGRQPVDRTFADRIGFCGEGLGSRGAPRGDHAGDPRKPSRAFRLFPRWHSTRPARAGARWRPTAPTSPRSRRAWRDISSSRVFRVRRRPVGKRLDFLSQETLRS
jgi:hypothetical protein